jgi:peroxiredoxin
MLARVVRTQENGCGDRAQIRRCFLAPDAAERGIASGTRAFAASAFQPHVGMPVPAFRASTLSGDSITLGHESGPRQLLFFLSTSCGFCLESLEGWKRIAEVITRDSTSSIEVLWVSLSSADSTKEYVERHGILQPVLLMNDRKMAGVYHANLVPLTVLLDGGRVSYARVRAISHAETIDSVLAAAIRIR